MRLRIFFILIILGMSACRQTAVFTSFEHENKTDNRERPYVVLVSYDGYRYDYPARFGARLLKSRTAGGVQADLEPVFPSKTFPSHYSLVTGLAPGQHGIVDNAFYDPRRNEEYVFTNPTAARDGSWYGGTPVWCSVQQAGLRTASFFWPGSSAEIDGCRPSVYHYYRGDHHYVDRVDRVFHWLDLPAAWRPHLIMLYFDTVDIPAHHKGPLSTEAARSVAEMDELTGRLFRGLAARRHLDVNVVILSDHGMQAVSAERLVFLDEMLGADLYSRLKFSGGRTNIAVFGKDADIATAWLKLKDRQQHFKVYRRPYPLKRGLNHYRNGQLYIEATAPWLVELRPRQKALATPYIKGYHGYPGEVKNMHGIFYAAGPQIKQTGRLKKPVDSLQVKTLLQCLLGINKSVQPAGSLAATLCAE